MRKKADKINGNSPVEVKTEVSSDSGIKFFRMNKRVLINYIGLTLLKLIYLFTGLSGLAGALYITVKVIRSGSISNLNMVLVFGLACIALAVMYAGMYGFIRLVTDKERRSVNTSHSSRSSKKGAA